MKKYRVTEKHPELKKGLMFEPFDKYEYICRLSYTQSVNLLNSEIIECVKNGWIEEIEEKEFTKSDMKENAIEFAVACAITGKTSPFYEIGNDIVTFSFSDFYEEWLKQRNES